ncbi:hypothetical protein IC229_05790 [Spirosoma sp. BT702]|uniref:Uncharacterized protein n=1 Tax=Spirosoma profusum TaxID=2771354 RepID=A0A927ATG2_9BACT|nr:hypothetical protein [Spirosoma profusum]MBD2700137.1 hypothetical protein [Spirosoma profusum]
MPKAKTGESAAPGVAARPFEVVNLEFSDHMPIGFQDRTYDLANLSNEDAAYLLGFPDEFPYLKALPTATND